MAFAGARYIRGVIPGPIEALLGTAQGLSDNRYIRGVIPGPIEAAVSSPSSDTPANRYIRGVIPGPIEAI